MTAPAMKTSKAMNKVVMKSQWRGEMDAVDLTSGDGTQICWQGCRVVGYMSRRTTVEKKIGMTLG